MITNDNRGYKNRRKYLFEIIYYSIPILIGLVILMVELYQDNPFFFLKVRIYQP